MCAVFRYRGREGFEEITLRFPVAQFAFLRRDSGVYLARYKPSLRVLNADGEVVRQVEAESQLTAESIEATVDTDRTVYDMVQVRFAGGALSRGTDPQRYAGRPVGGVGRVFAGGARLRPGRGRQ